MLLPKTIKLFCQGRLSSYESELGYNLDYDYYCFFTTITTKSCFHFRVFTNLMEQSGPLKLPGLNFTEKQQMWIAMTRWFCGGTKFSEESQLYRITWDDYSSAHPPDALRFLGPFSNSKKFNQDWNCPKDSRMNRAKKCAVWGDL